MTTTRLVLLVCFLACGACVNHDPAADPLPTCAEAGCPPPMPLVCTAVGLCSCPQNEGEPPIKCRADLASKGMP